MPSVKRLRSVANSLSQHCLSGLCQFAPEQTLAERGAGLARISVALIGPARFDTSLRARLTEILAKERIDVSVLASAHAELELRWILDDGVTWTNVPDEIKDEIRRTAT